MPQSVITGPGSLKTISKHTITSALYEILERMINFMPKGYRPTNQDLAWEDLFDSLIVLF